MSDLNPYEESLAVDLALAESRIEELEAKLAKAVEALGAIAYECVGDDARCGSRAALKELTGGQKDD